MLMTYGLRRKILQQARSNPLGNVDGSIQSVGCRRYASLTRLGTGGCVSGMFRRSACIAFAVMLVGPSTAHAADEKLTLACQGTATYQMQAKPAPISLGIIIDSTAQTIAGFTYPGFGQFPVKLLVVNEVNITFGGQVSDQSFESTIEGEIDRVTGDTKY